MAIILGGIVLALAFVIAGVIVIVREVPRLKLRMKKLETSLAVIPFAQATRDLERLQIAITGLQTITNRFTGKR